jgi:hypothetical protein
MGYLGLTLAGIAGLVSLVCFILVIIQMFQHGQTGLAIVRIILALCTGIGGLIVFIYGWVKSTEWGLKNVMLIWTAAFIVAFIGYGMGYAQIATMMGR